MDNHKTYKRLNLTLDGGIAEVCFQQEAKANALDRQAWLELQQIFERLDETPSVRVIVLKGAGKHFCSGIDVSLLATLQEQIKESCSGRGRERLRKMLLQLQANVSAIESCRKPVIAAIQGACIGGAIDIISACDMRYASADAFFSVKEIDMGMVADLGTLQRLPKIVGEGVTRELAFTARQFGAREAQDIRLINRCFDDPKTLYENVNAIAQSIAQKSPLATRGTKEILNFSREHSTADALNFVATWNAAMILSNDLREATSAFIEKRPPTFED